MKRVWNYAVTMWLPASAVLIGTLLIFSLYFYRLGSLLPAAPQETAYRTQSSSVAVILKNPIEAPYKIVRHMLYAAHPTITTERLLSTAIAMGAIALFYVVARKLQSKTSALYASLLFATSSIVLNTGRLALPTIVLPSLLILLICGYYILFHHATNKLLWFIGAIITGILLYTPSMFYFIAGGIILTATKRGLIRKLPSLPVLGICSTLILIVIAPLIAGFIRTPHILTDYMGIPAQLPDSMTFLKNIAAVPYGLFIQAPVNPLYRLGTQPILDIFSTVVFVIGIYAYALRYRLVRTRILAGIFVIGSLFAALTGNFDAVIVIVPFVYIVIGQGIDYLLKTWRDIFPHNPLARTVSVVLIGCAVCISANFHIWRYMVAWPHNQAVRAAFTTQKK